MESSGKLGRHRYVVERSPAWLVGYRRPQVQLMASRARIVATADQTRRRIERDLHDGAQPRRPAVVATGTRCGCRAAAILRYQPSAIVEWRWPRCPGVLWTGS